MIHKEYALIGYPLGHSFSERYFNEKFEREHIASRYTLFPIESLDTEADMDRLMQALPKLDGFNVTIPYKQKVMKFLSSIDPEAAAVGAVNVVKVVRQADKYVLKGYNSDIYGFYNSIKPLLRPHHTHALVLGTGGASKAVVAMLRKMGIEYVYVSRTKRDNALTYDELNADVMTRYTIIINCSPVGMAPNVDQCPDIPYQYITDRHLAYDLIYNPLETLFLQKAAHQGATIKNGLEMLYLQAEKAWEIWNKE